MNEETVTILVVEDHEVMRFGLTHMLAEVPNYKIIAETGNGLESVDLAQKLNPAIVLMDIVLPGIDGIEATRRIKASVPDARIIMFTSYDSQEYLFAALSAGAHGYCLKNISKEKLVDAVRSVRTGAVWLDPGIAGHVLKACVQQPAEQPVVPEKTGKVSLSAREIEVLRAVMDGLTNQEIADRLIVSIETVKTHMKRIMEKLAVSDRTQAAVKAMRQGLL